MFVKKTSNLHEYLKKYSRMQGQDVVDIRGSAENCFVNCLSRSESGNQLQGNLFFNTKI